MLKIDIEKKKKLEKLLGAISTPDEKQELQKLDALKIKEIAEFFNEIETDHQDRYKRLENYFGLILQQFDKYRVSVNRSQEELSEKLGTFTESLSKKLDETGGKITTSYEKNKPVNAAGVYKDMINQLSAIKKSVDDKPVPVWNWPQYASVGVRNKSFSNVNPSVDYFNIGSYDYVSVAYPINTEEVYTFKTNGATGNTVATITIVYTDSTKDNISTVTKTPVNA